MTPLLERRVVFVLGKGGVGKSVVAASLGLEAAARGRRTVIAEMNGAEAMSALLDVPPVGYEGADIGESLRAMSVTPALAVEEYLVRVLRFRFLYDLVFRNRLIAPFMDAVMGLSDLISVGKVMDLEWERVDGSFGPDRTSPRRYDMVVVDCPASGHAVSMLRSPQAMMDVTRAGPLFKNAETIRDLVADRAQTTVLLVTLPEEMPVAETIETATILQDELGFEVAGVVVNGVVPELLSDGDAGRWEAFREEALRAGGHAAAAIRDAERTIRDRARAEEHVERLRAELGLPMVELPLLPKRDLDIDSLRTLGRLLGEWT